MTTPTNKDLRAKAMAATPKDWYVDSTGCGVEAQTEDVGAIEIVARTAREWAAFIAAANPATVLGLLDTIDRLTTPADPGRLAEARRALAAHDGAPKCGRSSPAGVWTCKQYAGHPGMCCAIEDGIHPTHLRAALAEVTARDATIGELRAEVDRLTTERDEARAQVATEHQGCNRFAEAMRTEMKTVKEERDELRLSLLNERGEGEPPSEGWEWAGFPHEPEWRKREGAPDEDSEPIDLYVRHRGVWYEEGADECPWAWHVAPQIGQGDEGDDVASGEEKTARDAMKAADAALAGGTS